ncbi:hypothetical protein G9C98_008008 [Cotesia typhae]|uniref:RRM domain-containing protein n=1 Tax=Cotesia typhae TaxID=2053667 RepID=A0A8J5QTF0_9HYME|nr:hypothetical protein G9C98_008008 [Cotesia typhae]
MNTRVFVGGLTYRVRERDLEKFFRKYGRIKEVAMKNGYAFVVSLTRSIVFFFFYSMVGTRVYVGGLPYGTRERDLERFFRGYGRFRDVLIKNGYGFVEFEDYRDADDAVYELNGKELLGERITVERARGTPRGSDQWRYGDSRGGYGDSRRSADSVNRNTRTASSYKQSLPRYGPPTRTEYRLTVENLSSRVSWQIDHKLIAPLGRGGDRAVVGPHRLTVRLRDDKAHVTIGPRLTSGARVAIPRVSRGRMAG